MSRGKLLVQCDDDDGDDVDDDAGNDDVDHEEYHRGTARCHLPQEGKHRALSSALDT